MHSIERKKLLSSEVAVPKKSPFDWFSHYNLVRQTQLVINLINIYIYL